MGIEISILDTLQNIRQPLLDQIMYVITTLGNGGMIWILWTIFLLLRKSTRKTGLVMMMALVVDVLLCNCFLKNWIARTRPFDVNPQIELYIKKPEDYSFPSGHTAAAFASVTALFKMNHLTAYRLAAILAVLMAFSRLYFYVHFPTDILGGIFVGILAGYVGYWIIDFIERKRKVK